jgi:hypothetical protein
MADASSLAVERVTKERDSYWSEQLSTQNADWERRLTEAEAAHEYAFLFSCYFVLCTLLSLSCFGACLLDDVFRVSARIHLACSAELTRVRMEHRDQAAAAEEQATRDRYPYRFYFFRGDSVIIHHFSAMSVLHCFSTCSFFSSAFSHSFFAYLPCFILSRRAELADLRVKVQTLGSGPSQEQYDALLQNLAAAEAAAAELRAQLKETDNQYQVRCSFFFFDCRLLCRAFYASLIGRRVLDLQLICN